MGDIDLFLGLIECDGCNKYKLSEAYHFGYKYEGGDLCSDCFKTWDTHFEPMEGRFESHTCDCCEQYMTALGVKLGDEGEVCAKCWEDRENTVLPCFLKFAQGANVVVTDRECFFDNADVEVELPEGVTQKDLCDFEDMVYSIVRPAEPNFKPKAWAMLGEFREVPHFNAMCTFAVRVEKGKPHHVASVVEDDHGRIAMNIVFDSIHEHNRAKEAWEMSRPKDRQPYLDQVKRDFKEKYSCEEEVIAKATDSFAVYTRMMRKLACYYG